MASKVPDPSDLSPGNWKALADFRRSCELDNLATDTIKNYTYCLSVAAGLMGKDLLAATRKDVEETVLKFDKLKRPASVRSLFCVTLKKFYRWARQTDDYPEEVRWLKVSKPKGNGRLPESLLTEEDIGKMLDAARNVRDRALIAVTYETGGRRGEILSLRVGDVALNGGGDYLVFPQGKTGPRRVRLIFSAPHVAEWLRVHPHREDPAAPLWASNRDGAAIHPEYLLKLLKGVAARAGIKKPANPHAFRHARATALAKGLTEAQMKAVLGWTAGSNMPAVYVHLSGRDVDEALEKMAGVKKPDAPKESLLAPWECLRCRERNGADRRFCGRCAAPKDLKTALEREEGFNKERGTMGDFLRALADEADRDPKTLKWLEDVARRSAAHP